MFDNDTVELYKMAYWEGFNKSKKVSYTMRKKDAQKYAALICPDAADAIRAFGIQVSQKRTPQTEIEIFGQKVARAISVLPLKDTHSKQYPIKMKEPLFSLIEQSNGEKNTSYVKMYQDACDRFDFIPGDTTLAHFVGNSRTTWCNARKQMINLGYVLVEHQFGHIVKQRPPHISNEEIDQKMIASIVEEVIKKLKK